MPNIGPMEILLLGLLAVLIFGPSKLPEIGRSVGRAARDFKDAVGGSGLGDVRETFDTVNQVRSAASPTNIAKAAMPASVKQVASDVTDMKDTFSDPLGMRQEAKDAEAKEGAAKDAPAKVAEKQAVPAPAAAAPAPPPPAPAPPPVAAEPASQD